MVRWVSVWAGVRALRGVTCFREWRGGGSADGWMVEIGTNSSEISWQRELSVGEIQCANV